MFLFSRQAPSTTRPSHQKLAIISPFTQACFQPKQYGYFLYPDQERAYDATDVDFVQNRITEIDLIIPCPDFIDSSTNQQWNNVADEIGVKAIEIIYKDDNESTLKVLDTISSDEFASNTSDKIKYTYQSRAPYRVLPENELTRTSDKVPIKAQTQSVSGNRVIYGNYIDKHTSLESLNYQVGVGTKAAVAQKKEYYNHTVKQNRTYQAGFVLRDRYGRASDVILSSLDVVSTNPGTGVVYKGSTFFHPFSESTTDLITATETWPGDEISVLLNQPIPTHGPAGYPGIFRGYQRSYNAITQFYAGTSTYASTLTPVIFDCLGGSGTGLQIQGMVVEDPATPGFGPFIYTKDFPLVVNYGTGYADGDIVTIENPLTPGSGTAKFAYQPNIEPNLLGFSSYAIVIKQQEQDYYNVYTPGVLNNGVLSTQESSNNTATLSIFGDNINKIPKDLNDAAPTQRGFSSSTFLSYRVENVDDGGKMSNRQYFPGTNLDKVVTLGSLSDYGITNERPSAALRGAGASSATQTLSGFLDNVDTGSLVTAVDNSNGSTLIKESDEVYVLSYHEDSASAGDSKMTLSKSIDTLATGPWPNSGTFTFNPPGTIYNSSENPLLGTLSTREKIGLTRDEGMVPALTVFETKPSFSNLNIFWETTTTGDIKKLNFDILNETVEPLPTFVSDINFDLNEVDANASAPAYATNLFYPLDSANQPILDVNTDCVLNSVIDGNGNPANTGWTLVPDGAGRFRIQNTADRFCGFVPEDYTYNFSLTFTYNNATLDIEFIGILSNSSPATNYVLPVEITTFAADIDPGGGGQALPTNDLWPATGNIFDASAADNGAISNAKQNDLTLTLVSAVVTDFETCDDWFFQQSGIECNNPPGNFSDPAWPGATTSYDPPNHMTYGMYLGMDVRAWFWWLPVSPTDPFDYQNLDRFGGIYQNASIMDSTNFNGNPGIPPTTNPQAWLYWGGLPTANGPGVLPNSPGTVSTAVICVNVKITITIKAVDGAGAESTIQSTILKPWTNQYSNCANT